jgi:hypothetical protein
MAQPPNFRKVQVELLDFRDLDVDFEQSCKNCEKAKIKERFVSEKLPKMMQYLCSEFNYLIYGDRSIFDAHYSFPTSSLWICDNYKKCKVKINP